MFPLGSNTGTRTYPVITWTLTALMMLIYLWDRQWNLLGPSTVFVGLTMRPAEITHAFTGGPTFPLVTLFTSIFLHGSILHIVGNLIFLNVFGPLVESAFGAPLYALYFIFWGVIAGLTQAFVNPHSMIPTLGASGAISGVLGAYLLLFPATKIQLLILIIDIFVPAWMLLALWFAYQIFVPQEGIANWAHVGGFLIGMITVLVQGGRHKILAGREHDFYQHLYT